jgi:probable HAF family extracellular repeat protein
MNRKVRWITLAFILAIAAPVHQAIAYYQIIDLGTLDGRPYSYARSINNLSQIVGFAEKLPVLPEPSSRIATLFDPTGSGNNIALCETVSEAWSINNLGQIAGRVGGRATLFDPTGGGNNIDLDPGGMYSFAQSINDHGQIVGMAEGRATLFDPTGGGNNIDLGTLGGTGSEARSINNLGQIVGTATDSLGRWRATLFDPTGGGNNIDLGTTLGGTWSEASSINNLGQIVGQSWVSLRESRATLFDPTGGGNNIDLGTLPGEGRWISSAFSINNIGQIVGTDGRRAVLFDPTGGGNNIDLNTLIDPALGWRLGVAYSINDNGWIVGEGMNSAGYERAYLLIPEPATMALLGIGLLFLRKRYDG